MNTIEDIVRRHVPFIRGVTSKGWHRVYCEVCGDGSRTKGPRGGWNFDGDACFYHCFNCGVDANYDPNRDHPLSKDMYNVFQAFGIPHKEYKELELKSKSNIGKPVARKKISVAYMKVPDYFKPLDSFSNSDERATAARQFLWDNYRVKDSQYQFYLSTGETKSKTRDDLYWSRYLLPRVIVPAYYKHNMIYWQARIFIGESDKKYVSSPVSHSSSVIYGMDNLFLNPNKPLYITEGFFDSLQVNGIAVISNTMSKNRVEIISKSNRPKVVIPDFNHDGYNLAEQAIKLGWGVALPDIAPMTDLSSAVVKYGKLYVLKSIVKNTHHGHHAKVMLGLNKHRFKV